MGLFVSLGLQALDDLSFDARRGHLAIDPLDDFQRLLFVLLGILVVQRPLSFERFADRLDLAESALVHNARDHPAREMAAQVELHVFVDVDRLPHHLLADVLDELFVRTLARLFFLVASIYAPFFLLKCLVGICSDKTIILSRYSVH